MASKSRRKQNDRNRLTIVKIPPIARFCRKVVCSPKIGKIRICVRTATPYPTITLVMASTSDITRDCFMPQTPNASAHDGSLLPETPSSYCHFKGNVHLERAGQWFDWSIQRPADRRLPADQAQRGRKDQRHFPDIDATHLFLRVGDGKSTPASSACGDHGFSACGLI